MSPELSTANRTPHCQWRPSPLILVSLVVHAVVFAVWTLHPPWWPQLAALLAVNHALLAVCGLLPRSTWLGANITRLPQEAARRGEIAITIDDGPDPDVTPAVLDLLDRHGARATFFCIGMRAERHAALCREIVRRGHAVENHSHHHRHNFSLLGLRGIWRELQQAQDTLAAITGVRPRFVRTPAGLRNALLDPVLARLGLRLASWTRRGYDTRTGDVQLLLARLGRDLRGGDILLLHDGNAARTPDGRPVILEVLPLLLAQARGAGLRPVTLADAHR